MQSLRTRLWLTYTLLVVIVLIIVGVGLSVYLLRNPASTRSLYGQLQSAVLIMTRAGRLPIESGSERLQTAVERADENYEARITIFGPKERGDSPVVIADSRPELESPPYPAERMLQTEQPQIPAVYKTSSGEQWIYASLRLNNGMVIMASAPRPTNSWRTLLREELLGPLLRAGLVALAAAFLLALWIANWIAHPLQELAQAAHALQEDPKARKPAKTIEIRGPDEVREVAKAFNAMSQRVQASQQSQRDFVANVSHDLKTPLTAVQGFAQAILDGTASTQADLQQAARVILTESQRMNRMVLDLLELARLDSGLAELKLEKLDLRSLLEQVVEQFSLQIQRSQINVSLNIPALPNITGDRDRLARLFANLLDNAIKHTPHGETLHIQAHTSPEAVEIYFIDRGPGLPDGSADRVFDRFYQTDKSRSGTQRGVGLGLSIAREIVLAHGGMITAYNNGPIFKVKGSIQQENGDVENSGTAAGATFLVKLPLVSSAHQSLKTRRFPDHK